MSLASTPTHVLARRRDARVAELREYERQLRDTPGGWLEHDPRALRLRALGDEVDELEAVLAEREYVAAHEDDDDHDQI